MSALVYAQSESLLLAWHGYVGSPCVCVCYVRLYRPPTQTPDDAPDTHRGVVPLKLNRMITKSHQARGRRFSSLRMALEQTLSASERLVIFPTLSAYVANVFQLQGEMPDQLSWPT